MLQDLPRRLPRRRTVSYYAGESLTINIFLFRVYFSSYTKAFYITSMIIYTFWSKMSEADHQLKEAVHVALINVVPRGDDQVHLIEFLRSTIEVAVSSEDLSLRIRSEDLLLRIREVCPPKLSPKSRSPTTPICFWQKGSSSPHTERTLAEENGFPSSKEFWKLCLIMIKLSIKRASAFGRLPHPKLEQTVRPRMLTRLHLGMPLHLSPGLHLLVPRKISADDSHTRSVSRERWASPPHLLRSKTNTWTSARNWNSIISSRSPFYVPPFGRKPTSFTKMSSKTNSLLSVRRSKS
jgi:hypothetical protein